jgi:hypothetical protein
LLIDVDWLWNVDKCGLYLKPDSYELTPGIPRNSCYPASISWTKTGIFSRILSWAWDKSLSIYLSLSLYI